MRGRLDGKRAIVTGAATGIGRAIAELFAAEGARVCAADVNDAALETLMVEASARDQFVFAVHADVSLENEVGTMVAAAEREFGGVDVLANVAGIIVPGYVDTTSDDGWQRNLDVNLTGMFRCCRRTLPAMVRSGGGAVVNMSSVAGLFGLVDRAAYAVSKAGILALTRSIAVEYAGQGVRANAVCPGTIETRLTARRLADP
ncbi:MAG TPA: SDR family oxidoreductase, partial [Thermomicrobiaceae bacterium]|nr:SDR family oxidoreductase [Thermomicrobiaceae bacterium]